MWGGGENGDHRPPSQFTAASGLHLLQEMTVYQLVETQSQWFFIIQVEAGLGSCLELSFDLEF